MRSRFFVVLSAVLGLVACAAPAIPDDSGASQGNANTTKKPPASDKAPSGDDGSGDDGSGDDGSSPAPSGKKPGGPAPPSDCKTTTSQTACFTCCDQQNPQAVQFLDGAYKSCACQSSGACASECAASFCTGKQPASGDACDTCLAGQQDVCGTQSETACSADATCAQIFACSNDAQCFTKP